MNGASPETVGSMANPRTPGRTVVAKVAAVWKSSRDQLRLLAPGTLRPTAFMRAKSTRSVL